MRFCTAENGRFLLKSVSEVGVSTCKTAVFGGFLFTDWYMGDLAHLVDSASLGLRTPSRRAGISGGGGGGDSFFGRFSLVLEGGHGDLGGVPGSAAGCAGVARGVQAKCVKSALPGGAKGAFAGPLDANPGGVCGVCGRSLRVIGHCNGLRVCLPESGMGCHKKDTCNNCARKVRNDRQKAGIRD
jgi:hypothetical protein